MSVPNPRSVSSSHGGVHLPMNPFEALRKATVQGASYALSRYHWRTLRTENQQPVPDGTAIKTQAHIKKEVLDYLANTGKIEVAPAQNALSPLFAEEQAAFVGLVANNKDKEILLKFWADAVAKSQPAQGAAPVAGLTDAQKATQELLAQLLFLVDRDAAKYAPRILGKDFDADKKALQSAFADEVKAMVANLDAFVKNETDLRICDPVLLRAGMVPKAMAKAMVASTGFVNLGISESLKKALFLPGKVAYQKEINRTLEDFAAKKTRWDLLQQTKAPTDKNSSAWALIVATLDLAADHVVTDVDAKRACLSAHLTLLEQANIGNCFADSVGKLIKKLRPDRFGTDMNVLLTDSKLVRKVHGHERPIDFVLNGNNSDLQNPIKLCKNGTFQQFWGNYFVWQSNGFKMAANALGIPADKYLAAMKAAVESLAAKKKSDKYTTTAQELILELAGGDQTKAQTGNFGFTSLRENPLLRAWENILAEMAEMRPRSLVRGQILRCVKETLKLQLKTTNAFDDDLVAKVFKQFMVDFNNKVAIEYNPNTKVGKSLISRDGKSNTDGAFIIKGVTSGNDFQKLVVTTMKATADTFLSTATADKKGVLQAQVDKINKFVMDKTFLSGAIRKFDPQNAKAKEPVALPWLAPYGDDPFMVMRTYFEERQKVADFQPLDAQDLFVKLLDFAKDEKKEEQKAHPSRTILCSPQHAFEFLPNLPVFAKGVQSNSSKTFVANYVHEVSKLWNNAALHVEDKKKIVNYVCDNLLPTKDVAVAFREDVESIDRGAKLGKFFHELTARVEHYQEELDAEGRAASKQSLHNFVLSQALPPALVQEINKYVVPFADTNWQDEDNTLLFCFYPDPIAKKIAFGYVANDGTRLTAMSQDEWVNNQPWEISKTEINVAV